MTSSSLNPEGHYPRPQLVRKSYSLLDVVCGFAFDDDDRGRDEHWETRAEVFDRQIQLPFAPESQASGIGETGFHPVVWYRILVDDAILAAAGRGVQGDDVILHFGAVDYAADIWVNGKHVLFHEGGQVAFSVDITAAIEPTSTTNVIVVRAFDPPTDISLPRGKQDWMPEPHRIWYHRTTGIWRTVWIEAVPRLRVSGIVWTPDLVASQIRAEVALSSRPVTPVRLTVILEYEDSVLAELAVRVTDDHVDLDISVEALRNNHVDILWSPDSPRIVDATLSLETLGGVPIDDVTSYLGIRSVSVSDRHFLLNDRPLYIRSVLEQGYWPQSHFTAPSVDALREEVELILSLGFNAARIHQKAEDPRFLYWCDRLGLMIWSETAGAYEFSARAVERLTTEWMALVAQYRSHPSIVTWVPFNESWGIPDVAHVAAERAFSLALTNLTRAIDGTRPVVSNDGWEHTDSDIWTIHDYDRSADSLRERYSSPAALASVLAGFGPAGRRIRTTTEPDRGQPVMLTEFGGISYAPTSEYADSWGYSATSDPDAFRSHFVQTMEAVHAGVLLSGFCYTQLTDTRQETNGLCDENRVPKIPVEVIRSAVQGHEFTSRRARLEGES